LRCVLGRKSFFSLNTAEIIRLADPGVSPSYNAGSETKNSLPQSIRRRSAGLLNRARWNGVETRRGTMKNGNPEYAENRRSFLRGSLATGAAIAGATVLGGRKLFAQTSLSGPTSLLAQASGSLTNGDAAILRFLAAVELIESDLWTQYGELGGIGKNPPIEIDPDQKLNNYQVACRTSIPMVRNTFPATRWMK
jgi:hypothetical protein